MGQYGPVATTAGEPAEVGAPDLGLRPLTARSVIASVLLGSHPPILAVRSLVRVGELFGIAEGTIRVALSRMAADGELLADGGHYRLGRRLEARQATQDRGWRPDVTTWSGTWEIVLGPPLDEQPATVGDDLTELNLAWAGGRTWMRPANLFRPHPAWWPSGCRCFDGRPESDEAGDRALARSLWDLDGWAARSEGLLDAYRQAGDPAERFVAAAGILRHLRTDPALPDCLVGGSWPASSLRAAYDSFTDELHQIMITSGRP